jgi:hypothetical protein
MTRSVNFEVMKAVDFLIKNLEIGILNNQIIDHLRIVY